MKSNEIPQDQSKSLAGQRKPLYVLNEEGEYTTVLSSGWEAEEIVLNLAIEQFDAFRLDALERARNNLSSPLEYHMYNCRMDLMVLAQSTGLFRWRIKRHFKFEVFLKLSNEMLSRYAEVLSITIAELKALPPAGDQT